MGPSSRAIIFRPLQVRTCLGAWMLLPAAAEPLVAVDGRGIFSRYTRSERLCCRLSMGERHFLCPLPADLLARTLTTLRASPQQSTGHPIEPPVSMPLSSA